MDRMFYDRATSARTRLTRQLRRDGSRSALLVADALEACATRAPCRSAACPVCGLAWQQAAVSVVDTFIRQPARGIRGRAHALTIVPTSGCIPPDELTVAECRRVSNETLAAMSAFGLPPSVIGLEVSFNEDLTGEVEDSWSIHCHTNSLDWPSDTQTAALKSLFQSSNLVKRPIFWEPLDDDARGSEYPFKRERVRRVTDLVTGNPGRKPYKDTKRRELRPWQAAALAIVDHELGFEGRLLTHQLDNDAVWRHLFGLGWARDGP